MAKAQPKKSVFLRIWSIVRWAIFAGLFLIAVPVVLVPLYLVVNPISTPMLGRYVTGQSVTQDWRDIETISDRLKVTVVMSEDGQFCRHWGVDVSALRAEVDAYLSGEPARGASTLTMQVARNLFLWRGRSPVRKALEVPLAVYIDLIMPKRRIMEIYLNIAEWGPAGEFGIEAGVQRAFGIDGDALSWDVVGLMVSSLPNPIVRNPATPSSGQRRVANIIVQRAQTYADRAGCLFNDRAPEL